MFSNAFDSISTALRQLVSIWKGALLILGVYVALLVSAYLFVGTREATILQLVVSLGLFFSIPILFFLVQAISVNYAETIQVRTLLKKSIVTSWKLAVVTVPVVLLTVLGWYGLTRLQIRLGIGPPTVASIQGPHKSLTLFTTIRFALVGVVAPLLLINLWISTSSVGLSGVLKSFINVLVNSFNSESFLIYAMGSLVFLFAPYFILNKSITSQRAWIEIATLTGRLVISALMIILGWTATVAALAVAGNRRTQFVEE